MPEKGRETPTRRADRRLSSRPLPIQPDPGFYQGGGDGAPVFRPASLPQGSETPTRNLPACRRARRGWRDAAKTAGGGLRRPVWGPGYGRTWQREFRGLRPRCRSEGPHRENCPALLFRYRSREGSETPTRNLPRGAAHDGDGAMPPRPLGVGFAVPVWGPGYGRTWQREFRGLRPRCRSEGPHRENCPALLFRHRSRRGAKLSHAIPRVAPRTTDGVIRDGAIRPRGRETETTPSGGYMAVYCRLWPP